MAAAQASTLSRRWLLVSLLLFCSPGWTGTDPASEFLIVDCLLPGQVRQLGTRVTYVSARRAAKLSARECAARGGEFVLHDRASRAGALNAWASAAANGEPEAQLNVGTIYERGIDQPPDYEQAAYWYRLAADSGSIPAQLKLAELYESGLGVPPDLEQAVGWYRRATASRLPVVVDVAPGSTVDLTEELGRTSRRLDAMTRDNAKLEEQLAAANAALLEDRRSGAVQHADLEAQVLRLTALVADQRAAAADLQAKLRRAELALGGAEAVARRAQEQIRQQEGAQAEAERAAAQDQVEVAELGQALNAAEENLTHARAESDALRVRIAELEAHAEELAARQVIPEQALERQAVGPPVVTLIEPQLAVARGSLEATATAVAARRVVARVAAPAGLLSLSVNGMPATPNSHGVFLRDVAPGTESDQVVIVAVDQLGQRTEISFGVQPAPAPAEPDGGERAWRKVDFGAYHALVIGINDYRHLPRLQTAVGDAGAVADALERRYGFRVTRLVNPNRYEILSALNDLREALTSEDNLIVYYAGHGELDRVNMRGHWLPADAEADSTANWISNVAITDILNAMQARHVLLLADSCYSGALTRSALTELKTGMTEDQELNWIETMLKRRSRLALTSGGLSPVLDGGGGANSVFAAALLEVLQNNRDLLDGEELYDQVAARVAYRASNLQFEQVPEFAPIRHAGHEAGSFFLRPLEI